MMIIDFFLFENDEATLTFSSFPICEKMMINFAFH